MKEEWQISGRGEVEAGWTGGEADKERGSLQPTWRRDNRRIPTRVSQASRKHLSSISANQRERERERNGKESTVATSTFNWAQQRQPKKGKKHWKNWICMSKKARKETSKKIGRIKLAMSWLDENGSQLATKLSRHCNGGVVLRHQRHSNRRKSRWAAGNFSTRHWREYRPGADK